MSRACRYLVKWEARQISVNVRFIFSCNKKNTKGDGCSEFLL